MEDSITTAIALGLTNTVAILAKIIWDMTKRSGNNSRGNPNGLKKQVEMLGLEFKEFKAEAIREYNKLDAASRQRHEDIKASLDKFSARVDRRDELTTDRCNNCIQRITTLEAKVQ